MNGIIYKCENIVNGKVYIGQTIRSLKQRISSHYSAAKIDTLYFHEALNKYNKSDFVWSEIDSASSLEELASKEQYWIAYYNSNTKEFGYNLTSGGELNKRLSDSAKQKISIANKGKIISAETRQLLSERLKGRVVSNDTRLKHSMACSGSNNPMYGKKFTEEHRRKIGEASKGRHHSDETKEKISLAHRGKIVSEETRQKLSVAKTGKKLPSMSESTKLLLREKNLGGNNPNAKKVFCIELNTIYNSIQEAADALGIHRKQISRCCNKQLKKTNNLSFKFII